MKLFAAFCALLMLSIGAAGSAGATRKHKRPFCSLPNTRVLRHTSTVRVLYVARPDEMDLYGTPATVYACFPARRRRTKLFEVPSTVTWTPKIMALTNRYFAFFATTDDGPCEKGQQPNCTGSYVADYRLSNGRARCSAPGPATALALTSNGWIAWLSGLGRPDLPATVSACDSAGTRTLDQGTIDPASLHASGTSVQWTRDGQPQSAALH
jgi:hypothetical protein